jgi:hypothetical protein
MSELKLRPPEEKRVRRLSLKSSDCQGKVVAAPVKLRRWDLQVPQRPARLMGLVSCHSEGSRGAT